MKKYLKQVFLLVGYITLLPYLRFLFLRCKYGRVVRIITFHDIATDEWEAFEQILILLRSKYSVLTPEQFVDGTVLSKKLHILITFDDGYKSWVKAAQLLHTYRMNAIGFVCSGFLDLDEAKTKQFLSENLKLQQYRVSLTSHDLKTLVKYGWGIGGHTANHVTMGDMAAINTTSEISNNKTVLESIVSSEIIHFAFPYGRKQDIDVRCNGLLQAVGYTHAYTTQRGFVTSQCDQYALPRDMIDATMYTSFLLRTVLLGTFDFLGYITKLVWYFRQKKK